MKGFPGGKGGFGFAAITAVFCLLIVSFIFVQTPSAATMAALADKHKERGLACTACHKESPPKEGVSSSSCNACHGDLVALAERTAKKSFNPHAAKELNCILCHKGHK